MSEETDSSGTRQEVISLSPDLTRGIKIFIGVLAVMLCAVMIMSPLMTSYNMLVDSDLQVHRAAANVQTDLERRADLLPNLVATVQGSAEFEHNTLVQTIAARAGADANAVKMHVKNTNPTDIGAIDSSNSQLTTVMGAMLTLTEQYPQLQTVQQFRDFSAQATATENEILVDRQTYNAAVMQYQSICRSFPTNLVAGYYGFNPDKYAMYVPKDSARAEAVPTVTFDMTNL